MNPIDREVVIWLNGLSGNVALIDDLARVIATDYLMPLVFSLAMFGMWFAGRSSGERLRFQHWVLIGISSIGLSNVSVVLINLAWERTRPYAVLDEIELLFYRATDPSFPANPVAIGFAAGAAAWMANRKFGYWLFGAALVYGLSRVYAGVFYPTDVLGGAVVGVLTTWGTTYLHRLFQPVTNLFVRLTRGLALG
ncbi:MAG: phosphatase PAP2 family protein [Chloroflexi bacterium]|nr:phosphatase PAP2 family protein [Chloroflexota bacterium]MDA1297026.1 phosphatase PAP2 family protein [Chloroflexota bacterium]